MFTRARLEKAAVFFAGAYSYGLCELFVRGRTHITMGLLGGLAMLFIHYLGDRRRGGMPVAVAVIYGAAVITALEYVAGLILNLNLGLGIWDYSSLRLNYRGQICPEYSLKWCLITAVGIVFDELLRRFVLRRDIYLWGRSRVFEQLLKGIASVIPATKGQIK